MVFCTPEIDKPCEPTASVIVATAFRLKLWLMPLTVAEIVPAPYAAFTPFLPANKTGIVQNSNSTHSIFIFLSI